MSEYKLDVSKYTIDEQPIMWSDEEYREAFQSLYFEYHKLKSERDTLNNKLNQAYENGYQMEGELHDMTKQRDTLIEDLTWYKAKVERLEQQNAKIKDDLWCTEGMLEIADNQNEKLQHENSRLTRLTHKLTTHRTMWDELKQWRRDMLEIDKNDTQLISLGLVMDDLEHNWLYREEK